MAAPIRDRQKSAKPGAKIEAAETVAVVVVVDQPKSLPAVTVILPELVKFDNLSFKIEGHVITHKLGDYIEPAKKLFELAQVDPDGDDDELHARDLVIPKLMSAEGALTSDRALAISEFSSLSEYTGLNDQLRGLIRDTRLLLQKQVKNSKKDKLASILRKAQDTYRDELMKAEQSVRPLTLMLSPPDFSEVMKGKKSTKSAEAAVDAMLLAELGTLHNMAVNYKSNMNLINSLVPESLRGLVTDTQSLVEHTPDEIRVIIAARLDDHKKAEVERLEKQRIENERILKEKADELERQAQAKIAAAQAQAKIDAENKRLAELKAADDARKAAEREKEQKAAAVKTAELEQQAKDLRDSAKSVANAAQYADRTADMRQDLAHADALEKEALKVEAVIKSIKLAATFDEALLNDVLNHMMSGTNFDQTQAEQWLLDIAPNLIEARRYDAAKAKN